MEWHSSSLFLKAAWLQENERWVSRGLANAGLTLAHPFHVPTSICAPSDTKIVESRWNITEEIILEILKGRQGRRMESILGKPVFIQLTVIKKSTQTHAARQNVHFYKLFLGPPQLSHHYAVS